MFVKITLIIIIYSTIYGITLSFCSNVPWEIEEEDNIFQTCISEVKKYYVILYALLIIIISGIFYKTDVIKQSYKKFFIKSSNYNDELRFNNDNQELALLKNWLDTKKEKKILSLPSPEKITINEIHYESPDENNNPDNILIILQKLLEDRIEIRKLLMDNLKKSLKLGMQFPKPLAVNYTKKQLTREEKIMLREEQVIDNSNPQNLISKEKSIINKNKNNFKFSAESL